MHLLQEAQNFRDRPVSSSRLRLQFWVGLGRFLSIALPPEDLPKQVMQLSYSPPLLHACVHLPVMRRGSKSGAASHVPKPANANSNLHACTCSFPLTVSSGTMVSCGMQIDNGQKHECEETGVFAI